MKNLKITERRNGDVAVLDLEGNIRIGEGSAEFRAALRGLVARDEKKVLLNLSGVTYVDSSGLGEMVAGYTSLQKSGGELKLVHLTNRINELMTITKLLTVFEVFENETAAVESFAAGAPSANENFKSNKVVV